LLHLLDANVLITASRDYYQLSRVPEFWEWLLHMGEAGNVKLVQEIAEEITSGNDELAGWLSDEDHLAALRLDEEVDIALLQHVIATGYASDLTDTEIEAVGRDPFLIAYALRDTANRRVVTTEISRPTRQRHNRHVPDVRGSVGVTCMNSFELVRTLDFSTSWRTRT